MASMNRTVGPIRRWKPPGGPLLWVILIVAAVLCRSHADERPGLSFGEVRQHAADLRTFARTSLDRGDLSHARKQAESAYRLAPSAGVLSLLGVITREQKLLIEAADLARRAMALGLGGNREELKECQRTLGLLLSLPHARTGELDIFGDAGAFVIVDDRLVGRLPLPGTVLVPPSAHRVRIESGQRSSPEQTTEVIAGGRSRVRMHLLSGMAVSLTAPGLRPEAATAATARIDAALSDAGVWLAPPAQRDEILGQPGLRACLNGEACGQDLLTLPEQTGIRYLLQVEVDANGKTRPADLPARHVLRVRLIDLSAAAPWGRPWLTGGCQNCTLKGALEQVGDLAREVVRSRDRAGGVLVVRTGPQVVGQVLIDGQLRGKTPYQEDLPRGEHQVEVQAVAHRPFIAPLAIAGGEHLFDLRSVHVPRPRVRLIGGGILAALGLVVVGLGATALALDGKCIPGDMPDGCAYAYNGMGFLRKRTYQSRDQGLILVLSGIVGFGGGVTLAAWPSTERTFIGGES